MVYKQIMDNKTKILEIAMGLFSLKGFDATGIQEIVDKSNIGKPTLYYYFGNKEGVLEAIFDRYFTDFNTIIEKASYYTGDITKSLTDLTICYFTFALQNKVFFKMMLSMSCHPVESQSYKIIQPYLETEFGLFEKLFKNAEKDHGNMKGRSFLYTISFIGILNTYITLLLNKNIELDDTLYYKVVHQFMHGIFS